MPHYLQINCIVGNVSYKTSAMKAPKSLSGGNSILIDVTALTTHPGASLMVEIASVGIVSLGEAVAPNIANDDVLKSLDSGAESILGITNVSGQLSESECTMEMKSGPSAVAALGKGWSIEYMPRQGNQIQWLSGGLTITVTAVPVTASPRKTTSKPTRN